MSISELQNRIRELCEEQGVKRLDLFGSRARSLNGKGNDYDFVADFLDYPPAEYSKRFFSLLHALEDELKSPVDLMTYNSLNKKSLKRKIESERISLYER